MHSETDMIEQGKHLSLILTVEEVSILLRVPCSTVYKLAQEGKIPAQKVGRHWRFHRPTLEQWVTGQNNVEAKRASLWE